MGLDEKATGHVGEEKSHGTKMREMTLLGPSDKTMPSGSLKVSRLSRLGVHLLGWS